MAISEVTMDIFICIANHIIGTILVENPTPKWNTQHPLLDIKIDTMCGGVNLFLLKLITKSLLELMTNSIITPKKRKSNINNRRKNMQNVHKSNKNSTWSTNNDNLFL
jgi:hypothetical protein